MKAIICTKYGPPDVLQLKEIPRPIPMDDEALVKIHAASLNAADFENMRGVFIVRIAAPRKPMYKILGSDFAGRIEAVGVNVKQFQPGDEIWGDLSFPYGYSTFAEYVCIPEKALRLKPASMTFEEAAAVPTAGVVALQHLVVKRPIEPGQNILINGAGGGVGTFAVQIAKHFGAEVTGVDSGNKLDMLRSLGADHVVDYTQEDFTKSGEIYDVIFDVIGKISFSRSAKSIKQDGTYLLANPVSQMVQALWTRMTSSRKVIMETASGTIADLVFLRGLVEEGKIRTVIDKSFPLEEIVEAHRFVEKGGKLGNVVITVGHSNKT
jgi:NADPH:quinone reductase-like Zn-dependent oxidoreductase